MTDDNPEDQSKPETSDEGADAPSDGEAKDGEAKDGEAKDGEAKDGEGGTESADTGRDREPSPPQQLLDALQDEIDETRRRLDVSRPDEGDTEDDDGDKAFVEEGERDEDEPVDDTIAPPG